MICKKIAYIFHISFLRVVHKKKLFLILLLSLTSAIIVPFIGTSLIESLVTQKNNIQTKYSDTTFAYRIQTAVFPPDTTSYIMNNICDIGVMVNLYNEYVILHPDTEKQSGRFIDINAIDAHSFSIFYPVANEQVKKSFTTNESVCIIDYQTAKKCSLRIGDTVSIQGNSYKISFIVTDQNSSFICIPYSRLSSNIVYQHTLYLFYDTMLSAESALSMMHTVFPDATDDDIISLTESHDTKQESIVSTLSVILLITVAYMICAIINISTIRYGDIKINQHDYAVSLALGCTKRELLLSILFENLILTPLALIVNILLFFCIRHIIPFPYYLSISLFTIVCIFLFAFLCSCFIALTVTNKMFTQCCATMLKEL